ncbi:MAG: hypothetical protein FIA95_15580, partial [Gemmatimonadetes bacterium]|nr:hypothetical protein [Gemmatimonadota bacterium]
MSGTMALLQESRRRELEQVLFYRLLAWSAAHAGDAVEAERLQELLADEQHHVSRLTARILEMGGAPESAGREPPAPPSLGAWEAEARGREGAEVTWYETALADELDPETRSLLGEILDSERHHREGLAGKWMPAGPTTSKE